MIRETTGLPGFIFVIYRRRRYNEKYIAYNLTPIVSSLRRRKEMYKNIGGKIKKLAFILCIIGIVVSVILGLLIGVGIGSVVGSITSSSYYGSSGSGGGASGILLFILIAGGGSLLSWISSFTLYGFGQMIENTDIIRSEITMIKAGGGSMTGTKGGFSGKAGSGLTPPSDIYVPDSVSGPAMIRCPECGSDNEHGSLFCFRCGHKLS